MSEDRRIMYVCSECADVCPEACGHYDRNDLRAMPNGMWLCESCFDETDQIDRGGNPDESEYKGWADLPPPREYTAKEGMGNDGPRVDRKIRRREKVT